SACAGRRSGVRSPHLALSREPAALSSKEAPTMSKASRNLGRAALLMAIAVGAAAPGGTAATHATDTPATPSGPTPAAPKDPRIADLASQIKTLRNQYPAQLDPLEAQVKALRDKFDPEIASLEDQRRTLVEAAKPPQARALDDQEAAELKQLADQEKSEVDQVRQRFADRRKQVQEKYKEQRQQLPVKKWRGLRWGGRSLAPGDQPPMSAPPSAPGSDDADSRVDTVIVSAECRVPPPHPRICSRLSPGSSRRR